MIKATLSELVTELDSSLKARLVGADVEVGRIVTDSRANCKDALFVALRGPHFDAHDFLAQVIEQGAKAVVVEHESVLDIPQILVTDSKVALGELARINRNKSKAKFVAITGSSGKTTVKEMIASILQDVGETHATRGNFNNEIGVPLTLLEMNNHVQFGVIELGASRAGEIAYTAAITQPDVALINNVAAAHLQGFGDLQGVARAKGEIFSELKQSGIAIINNDDDFAGFWKKQTDRQILTFSTRQNGDVISNNVQLDKDQCPQFEIEYAGEKSFVCLPLAGSHNVSNALAAAASCLALGVALQDITKGLSRVPVVSGRLMTKILSNGCRIIDDSYNANLDSMRVAINLLAQYDGRKILVIGDMAELGEFGRQCHEEVGKMAKEAEIDFLYTCGVLTQFSLSAFIAAESQPEFESTSDKGQHFSNQLQLIKIIKKEAAMESSKNGGTTILIKGSRSAHMENVVMALMECSETNGNNDVDKSHCLKKEEV